jgi:CBS domain-containing protein
MAGKDAVSELMSKTVRSVDSASSLGDVLKVMIRYDVGSVIVTEMTKPFGIVTERDIIRRLGDGGSSTLTLKAGEVASRPLITMGPEAKVWEAFAMMLKKKIRRLPIMSEGTLVGILTERDMLKWVVGVTYEPNIPDEIKQLIGQNP